MTMKKFFSFLLIFLISHFFILPLRAQKNGNITDEFPNKVMNEKIKIMTFPCEIYNLYDPEKGFNLLKTKIIHIKGNVKNVKDIIMEFKLRYFFNKFLKIFPKFLIKQIRLIISIKSIVGFVNQSNKVEKIKKGLVYGLKIKKISKFLLVV